MTASLLQGRRFYCREWAFSKILHCLDNLATSKTSGALIMGGPGCGKSAMCSEIVWPTSNHGRQGTLSKRILAYYFCQAHDIETLSITNFVHCMVEQISKSSHLSGFEELIQDPVIQTALDPVQCEKNPDEAFRKGIIEPLLKVNPPSQNIFILLDSIDESYLQSISERTTGSRTIAELLANHHHLLPKWLLIACSARKQSKTVTRLFTGFRKISLDDLRKSHVVKDVQQYIICRLDHEEELRQHLSRETAEMLNQLHIKSNGCFLYLEKVLDGVGESFILLREIREIPGTLNGLYLWLCQRLFVRKQFAKVLPILNVILAARRPLTDMELYSCAYTRNTALTFDEFKRRMELLSKLLIEGHDGTKILFHHSFAEWLLDVKHCTQKYLCTASEGHGMLAMSFTMHAPSLTPLEIQDYALHLVKGNVGSPLENHHLTLWMITSGAAVEESLGPGIPKEQSVYKLLVKAGAKLPSMDDSIPPPPSPKQPAEPEDPIGQLIEKGVVLDDLDSNGRTMLCNAAYKGNSQLVTSLLAKGAGLELQDKTGQTALNLAARQGHAEVVAALLKSGAEINHPDNDGWTPLRSSAWGGHTDVVSLLLEGKAEVDHADSDDRTALRAAAWGGHDDIVKKLTEHGAKVNKIDNEGRTALIAAAYMGHTEIVEYLLDHGADINHEDIDGRTALSVAALCIPASEGHSNVVSLLLERKAEVDHRDKDGMTPLLVAAYEGHHDVCELLLEFDADVDHADHNGRAPLQAAASMGHADVISLLLFWGAAVDAIDADGRTVLCIAAQQGNVDVVRQLLDRGLDELHRDNGGWTPMHIAAYEGHKEAVDALIESGARVTEVDNDGRIPMILAAQEGHLPVVSTLLEANSPLESRAHDGKTSLRVAALEGHKDVVHYLLCNDANIDYQDADGRSTLYVLALEDHASMAAFLLENRARTEVSDLEGRTPLHVAAWQGHYQITLLLLEHRAKVDAVDNDSRTSLQSAAWQGHADIVRLLLEHSAKVDHTCNQGATALCIAAQEGHEEVVKILLRHKANPNHADQYGRTATRVALKGGHGRVVKLLEEHGALPQSGVSKKSVSSAGGAGGTADTHPRISHPASQALASAMAIADGHLYKNNSPHASPGSTFDKHKTSSNGSKSSTGQNTSSTSSGGVEGGQGMTFTQQLQKCSASKNRRSLSRVLSPVSEPASPSHSHSGSPLSDVAGAAHLSPTLQESPTKAYSPQHSDPSRNPMRIISNPGEKDSTRDKASLHEGADTEPIWQRQADFHSNINAAKLELHRKGSMPEGPCGIPMSGISMGQTALAMKSPDISRKRNGIVTNPNYSIAKSININGYYNKLSETVDNFPVPETTNGNASLQGKQKATRPNGLPLKKETPL